MPTESRVRQAAQNIALDRQIALHRKGLAVNGEQREGFFRMALSEQNFGIEQAKLQIPTPCVSRNPRGEIVSVPRQRVV